MLATVVPCVRICLVWFPYVMSLFASSQAFHTIFCDFGLMVVTCVYGLIVLPLY